MNKPSWKKSTMVWFWRISCLTCVAIGLVMVYYLGGEGKEFALLTLKEWAGVLGGAVIALLGTGIFLASFD